MGYYLPHVPVPSKPDLEKPVVHIRSLCDYLPKFRGPTEVFRFPGMYTSSGAEPEVEASGKPLALQKSKAISLVPVPTS